MDAEFCALVGRLALYLEQHPREGAERLREFMDSGGRLLTTDDVMKITGWTRNYILTLCNKGLLPYIPGKPHRFLYEPLMTALHQLQVGGAYGRRKSKFKTKATAKKGA